MRRLILGLASHGAVLAIGFGLGVYFLPILTAPDAPEASVLRESAAAATFSAEFTRDLAGSDFLHWGEGTVSLTATQVVHEGKLSPGPDFKPYLLDGFVQDEAGFEAVRATARLVGDVKSFDGFIVDLPEGTDPADFNTVVVWCEAFSEFITAAQYR